MTNWTFDDREDEDADVWGEDYAAAVYCKSKSWTAGIDIDNFKNEALSRANYEYALKVDQAYSDLWSWMMQGYPVLDQCETCFQLKAMGAACPRCIPTGRVKCPFTHTEGKKCIACKGLGHVEEIK